MKAALHFFLCILCPTLVLAQQDNDVKVTGRVLDTDGKPLEACIVAVLHPADSAIIAYNTTGEDGGYAVSFSTHLPQVLLRLTGFNVKRQMQRIDARSQTFDFKAEEESMVLREVQVKAQKLWGSRDTLNYLVAAYMKDQDRTIGDVLKQLPGITIDEGGTIKYQGTPINHFYIENMDVLQGRYTLATNGIRAEDVATVQVLENHEHVKALQDQVPPESAAINLKLKKKAKGVWTKNVDLTAGFDTDRLLWNCGADVMYFGKNRQHFLHYGNDNTGTGGAPRQYYGGGGINKTALVDVLTPGSAPVGCSLRNNSHAVNLNNLNKLSDTKQLHYNFAYSHDLQRRESFARTTYFMPDGGVTVMNEDIAARHTTNDADVQLTYENNADKRFFNNRLSLVGAWNDGYGTVQNNSKRIDQSSTVRTLAVSDAVRWVHRTAGGGGFEVHSTNSFSSSPQSLVVSGDMEAQQDVTITQASTSNSIEMLRNLRKHKWTIAPSFSVKGEGVFLSSMNSDFGSGDMAYYHATVGLGPVARYVNGDFRFTFRLPVTLYYTNVNNKSDYSSPSPCGERAGVRVSPSVSLLWKANDHFTFNVDGGYSASETPWRQLIALYVMGNYRSVNRYAVDLSDNHSATLHGKINFKDIFTGWFAYLDVSASRQWSDVVYGTTIDADGHTMMQAERMPHHSQNYRATAQLRKDIDWHAIQLELTPDWSRSESQLLRQGEVQDCRADNYAVRARLAFNVVKGYRLDYNFDWNRHRSVSQTATNVVSSFSQRAALQLTLVPKTLFFNITGNHTHNNGLSGKKDYAFLNLGMKLKTRGKMEWRLDCNNVLNTRHFVSRSTTDMTEYYHEYHLRSRSVLLSTAFNL